jgi:hypothetical protein
MTDTSGKGTQPYGSVTVVSDDVYFWPACPFLCVEQVKSTLVGQIYEKKSAQGVLANDDWLEEDAGHPNLGRPLLLDRHSTSSARGLYVC